MLSVWILNAGQGDSIVLRFPDSSWAVVDSNTPKKDAAPPALMLLKQMGVERLSFVCLTHPHADHYSGLLQILDHYRGRTDDLWMFPVDSAHIKKFLTLQYNKAASSAAGQKRYSELQSIFQKFHEMVKTESARTLAGGMRLPMRGDVQIDCLGPLTRDRHDYNNQLVRQMESPKSRVNENLVSVVLRLRYGLSTLLLSSDAPTLAWPRMWKEAEKSKEDFHAHAVKVSHHGSKVGHHGEIWKKMTVPQGTHAAISAGAGYGHPDFAVLKSLVALGTRLHCTNYPEQCMSKKPWDLSKLKGLPDRARTTLFMMDRSSAVSTGPCNGNIRFDLSPDGACAASHEFDRFCPLHM